MDRLNVTNPFNGSSVGEIMLSSEREVEAALAIAAKTHEANRRVYQNTNALRFLRKLLKLWRAEVMNLQCSLLQKGGSR